MQGKAKTKGNGGLHPLAFLLGGGKNGSGIIKVIARNNGREAQVLKN